MSTLEIGGRRIGNDQDVFVIAEAGVNHNGDPALALELVDAAADSGADAVKFQTFDPSELATDSAPLAEYQRGDAAPAGQAEMLAPLRLDDEAFKAIAARCKARGITFLSTPFDERSADLLEQLEVQAFKVGSGELTNLPFLRNLARRGRPLLVSTGMATLAEVADAVVAIREAGEPSIVLLHCVSSYPAPPEDANLRAMDTLRETFDVAVGFSDHSLGADLSLAAVARGASILERHLTTDRRLPGPDHAASLEPDEFRDLVGRLRMLERALGDGVKRPQPSEMEIRDVARRSIVAVRSMQAGERIDASAVAVKRPGVGLPPSRLDSVIGTRLARAIGADEPLTEAHLETRPQS
jgi:N-acetylneuraminate synthase/N,N'-diacetyllegionaminate synthase